MLLSSASAAIMEQLLQQEGEQERDVRTLSLATLNDDDLLSFAALFWTQLCWLWLLATTNWMWVAAFMVGDLALCVARWRLRRGLSPWGGKGGSETGTASAWINLVWIATIATEIFVLLQAPSAQTAFLGVMLAVGFAGYASAMFAAFPVLSTVNIIVLNCSLGLGLANGSSDAARPLAILSIGAAVAFWLLTRRSHVVLLGALRAQLANRQLSLHDPLTQLPNRTSMREKLTRHLGPDANSADGVAVLCLDLDGFKEINDRHGHAAGDWVLVHVADILRRALRTGDTASRIGGDEFVVVLPATDDAEVRSLAEAIIAAVAVPFDIGRTIPARVGVSIGGALAGRARRSVDDLLEAADTALYAAKRGGKQRFCMAEA